MFLTLMIHSFSLPKIIKNPQLRIKKYLRCANTPGEKINEVEDIWYTDKWETSSGFI